MSSKVKEPLWELEIGYQIGKYIQGVALEHNEDAKESPYDYISLNFFRGPDPELFQLSKGFMLETSEEGVPSALYSTYGRWTIMDCWSGETEKVFKVIEKKLGLVWIKKGTLVKSTFWHVKKWNNHTFPDSNLRAAEDILHGKYVKLCWSTFVKKQTHKDLYDVGLSVSALEELKKNYGPFGLQAAQTLCKVVEEMHKYLTYDHINRIFIISDSTSSKTEELQNPLDKKDYKVWKPEVLEEREVRNFRVIKLVPDGPLTFSGRYSSSEFNYSHL